MTDPNRDFDKPDNSLSGVIKTTLVGGILFLLPLGIFLVVLAEISDIFLQLASPIASQLPQEDFLGVAANNMIAVALALLVCFLAGLLAKMAIVSSYSDRIDKFVSSMVPGYGIMMSRVSGLLSADSLDERWTPVVANFGGFQRHGLEISRSDDGETATIYLPGSPNPKAGFVVHVASSNVTPASVTSAQLLDQLEFYGRDLKI